MPPPPPEVYDAIYILIICLVGVAILLLITKKLIPSGEGSNEELKVLIKELIKEIKELREDIRKLREELTE